MLAASDASFELGRARLELARVLVSLGREDAAAREATVALKRLAEIGAAAEAARARELLARLGVSPRPAPDQLLTPRQLEVLRLVSQGLTDNEIAAFFKLRPLVAFPGATWIKTEHAPVYSPEHMEQYRQFTSVITLTFRVIQ